jgi:Protein of unknown function (DUF1579)
MGNAELPAPDPALKRLDRFVGTWDMTGRTLDSDVDNVTGRTTFEWLPGGFFLEQRIELEFAGLLIQGLEVIGYDPASGTYPSTVFASMAGTPIPYVWEIEGDELTITTELLGANFRGKWSEDGTTFSGRLEAGRGQGRAWKPALRHLRPAGVRRGLGAGPAAEARPRDPARRRARPRTGSSGRRGCP